MAEIHTNRRRSAPPPPPATSGERVAHDLYVEPAWCVRGLLGVEEFDGPIHDPACGTRSLVGVLGEEDYIVTGSDIRTGTDFLKRSRRRYVNIISNPPFNLAEAFVRTALERTDRKVAFLLPLAFLESSRRRELFATTPLARVIVSRSRISMPPADVTTKWGGGVRAFAWYVWDHAHYDQRGPRLGWFDKVGE